MGVKASASSLPHSSRSTAKKSATTSAFASVNGVLSAMTAAVLVATAAMHPGAAPDVQRTQLRLGTPTHSWSGTSTHAVHTRHGHVPSPSSTYGKSSMSTAPGMVDVNSCRAVVREMPDSLLCPTKTAGRHVGFRAPRIHEAQPTQHGHLSNGGVDFVALTTGNRQLQCASGRGRGVCVCARVREPRFAHRRCKSAPRRATVHCGLCRHAGRRSHLYSNDLTSHDNIGIAQ